MNLKGLKIKPGDLIEYYFEGQIFSTGLVIRAGKQRIKWGLLFIEDFSVLWSDIDAETFRPYNSNYISYVLDFPWDPMIHRKVSK
jgi:hypothetical protein